MPFENQINSSIGNFRMSMNEGGVGLSLQKCRERKLTSKNTRILTSIRISKVELYCTERYLCDRYLVT